MPRFFIEKSPELSAASLTLRGGDFHHIRDVLRMKTGDRLTVCDGARNDLDCRIERFLPEGVELAILGRRANQTEPPYQAILYQGLAKGEKMATIIQKAVELGAARIVPVFCRRSVARLDEKDTTQKLQRWNRIAAEAAKQCGRGLIPEVAAPLSFAAAVQAAAQADICLIPWENEREQSLREVLEKTAAAAAEAAAAAAAEAAVAEAAATAAEAAAAEAAATAAEAAAAAAANSAERQTPIISLLIGPEGGFDADEIAAALTAGILPVTISRRILRTETAGGAVLAMLMYCFNDF